MTAATAAIVETAAPAPPAAPILRFDGLELSGDGGARGGRVSFAVTPGAMVALEGGPAAEVSRLMRLAALRTRPRAEGAAWFGGRDARAFSRREAAAWRARTGYLDQGDLALDHLTVFDNAALPRRLSGERPAEYRGPIEDLLRWVGLWRRAGVRPDDLTVAEQRRLSLAMALSRGPELLIADRPHDGLDDLGRAALLRLIGEVHRAGTTVLISCRPDSLSQLAPDVVVRLDAGR